MYTNLALCHRFIRFKLCLHNNEPGKQAAEKYCNEMYSEEDGILYHRIQEDEEIEELENYLEYSHIKCNSRGTDF